MGGGKQLPDATQHGAGAGHKCVTSERFDYASHLIDLSGTDDRPNIAQATFVDVSVAAVFERLH